MNPEIPTSPIVPPGPEPVAPPPGSPAPPTDAPWGGWLAGGSSSRDQRRAERHARRDARRAERGIGGSFWGVLLVLVGAGILASELVPGFDWNVAWPTILIAFGVLLILASIRRPPAGS